MTTSMKSDAAKAADLRNLETPEPFTPRPPRERPRFVDTRDAATILGLSARTLEKFRVQGGGPAYRKFGGRVLYAFEDLDVWAASAVRTSTSDPGPNAARPAKAGRSRSSR